WASSGPAAAAELRFAALRRLGAWFSDAEVLAGWSARLQRYRLRTKNAYCGYVQELYGDDVAAAYFAISCCGGGARFEGRDEWLRPDARGRFSPELLQLRDVPVVAIDLRGSAVNYSGLDNLVRLTRLRHLDLGGCRHLDDWALARLHVFGESLRELSVAGCPRVTERGLAALHHLRHLQRLDVSDLPAVPNKGLVRILLEEMLPHCQVVGMDYGDGLEPPPGPPGVNGVANPPPRPEGVLG
ncbi:distal membrane-arm assembly complex protein 2, partial [Apteryx rowi]|uniref:distal membrane-arm assembly complex protein 2 n=1 Tax=Apteryx rowi TaxID=308060 RepID=UPI000E1CAD04